MEEAEVEDVEANAVDINKSGKHFVCLWNQLFYSDKTIIIKQNKCQMRQKEFEGIFILKRVSTCLDLNKKDKQIFQEY